ncbi:MAG: VWA domain-containing protein [Trueperaceae bacterium]
MKRSSTFTSALALKLCLTLLMLAAGLAVGQQQGCVEAQANGREPVASLLVPGCVLGTLPSSPEVLVVAVTFPDGDDHVTAAVSLDSQVSVEACLLGGSGERLQCRQGSGTVRLVDLAPAGEGEYLLHLRQYGDRELPFQLELTSDRPIVDEQEPNDLYRQASPLIGGGARGRSSGDETDFYAFEAEGEPRLWRFEAEGAGVTRFAYVDGSGSEVQARGPQAGLASITNLFLLPGRHYLAVRGVDAPYTLRAIPLGPPGEGVERETNDDETRAQALPPFEERSGTLDPDDVDTYRLSTYAQEYVRLEIEPAPGTSLRIYLDDQFSTRHDLPPGEAIVYEALLPPGDHYLRVQPNGSATGDYRLRFTPLDPLALPADVEPNDEDYQARLLPRSAEAAGELSYSDREDWYRLPPVTNASTLLLDVEGGQELTFYRFEGGRRDQVANVDSVEGRSTVELPAADDIRLRVSGDGPYRLALDLESLGLAPQSENALRVDFESDEGPVAAYWHEGQRVVAEVTVENMDDVARRVELIAASSHYAWRPVPEETDFTLSAGERRSIPLFVEVLPDARDDLITRITVQARSVGGSESAIAAAYFAAGGPSATLSFRATCGVPPVLPGALWPVPDALLGGLNLAWSGFGGQIADAGSGGAPPRLIDGVVAPSTGWQGNVGSFVTFRLADDSAPLAGILLNPYAQGSVGERLAHFELQASDDGEQFEPLLSARLGPAAVEQAFLFDEPVTAGYLRLIALSNQTGYPGRITLGEFKAVTADASNFLGERGANLASPATGGYLVWSKPDTGSGSEVLDENSDVWAIGTDAGENSIEWAIGFHNNRAARIAALEWVSAAPDDNLTSIAAVDVAVSLESPVGPWTELGTWRVDEQAEFTLDEMPWARFVRLRALDVVERSSYLMPAAVRVREVPVSERYRTVLGEWGQNRRAAIFEALEQPTAVVALGENDDNDALASAQDLVPGELVEGRVVIGEDVDWYRITVPEGENSLELTLIGEPILGVRYELVDGAGSPLLYDQSGSPAAVTLSAFVEPGDYYLRLEEPPRSVVFAWDNSGSMGAYLDIIYQTVAGFVTEVQPGREAAQLLAFEEYPEGMFLLPDWSDDPLELMTALNNYGRTAGSSNAEANLLAATQALGERDGTRAIMFMTDAESNGRNLNPQLWTELERVRPRVFTFETSSAGSTYTQDLMQSWADVAGGYYDYARGVGDFEAGFARATCHLRRPAHYQLEANTAYRAPPGPGLLSVGRSEGVAGNPPVEIVLDLSGSMSRALPSGPSRVEVAKRVLHGLVTETLPEGTPFALRVFGHVRPNSCDTRLELPLAPLDRTRAQNAVATAQPQLLSGTPLAASLLEVPGDLGGRASGERGGGATVILLTDGEESCGGDVEAAVTSLRGAGPQVQLHIISFDVASEEAKAAFAHLADLGGGRFFDASDEEGLAAALGAALEPSFEVLDVGGTVVISGTVGGDPVSVPPGIYTVRVSGSGEMFEEVRVRGDDEQQLLLGGEGQ